MEENSKLAAPTSIQANEEESSSFNFAAIYTAVILNWKWFVLSVIICLGVAAVYLRYTTPIYQGTAKLLIKDNNTRGGRNMMGSGTLGTISNTSGIANEIEILKSHTLAEQAVRDLKLYVTYYSVGKVTDRLMYQNQPISVDIDPAHLEKLNSTISLEIERVGNKYHVTGTYYVPINENSADGPFSLDKTFSKLPTTIGTRAGILYFVSNSHTPMADGTKMKVFLTAPKFAANKFVGSLAVTQQNEATSIAQLILNDEVPQRAVDYLQQLALCYNRQANEDKNEVARRTEEFINGRLEKINAELGSTEGALESYKKQNRMVQQSMTASSAFSNADEYSKKLTEANTQLALLNEMSSYINNPNNRYQPIPSNVGLADEASTALINQYNEVVSQRNRLLQSASESSPSVTPLTAQLDDIDQSIRNAMVQARRNLQIQRNSVASEYGKYQGQVGESPEQERILTSIGRQQEVKSGLYLMLLQKREENSIYLAATADKGKLLDNPAIRGQVSPKRNMILLIALLIGLAIPSIILFLNQFLRYKIEGHDDVARLTKLPILADVAIASDTAKTKADIVVHENKNNQMEEIFRSLRTNLQFMLEGDEKVILFTSSTSGEGKTFAAANLSVSFALLGKKVLLVGLDIRKPRLAELFEIDDHQHGITNLLVKENPSWEQISTQVLPSGINNNLDVLLAGPIPPNPSELVARKSLDEIFKILREKYDYILIDTAPVGLVTDTIQIGRIADATIFLCRADYTPKEYFEMINSLDEQHKLPKMSIVINGIDMSKKKYGYYYGYGKYGRYGRYGRYSHYGKYGNYGTYGTYGSYYSSHYADKNDTSVKR
jgi:capsular exopolysaccharide synthesis family protein